MPLTREFKQTVQARLANDPTFREELLREGVQCLLSGDFDTGKANLRNYINATIGFEKLSGLTGKPSKSLMRMLGPTGNPQARNLFAVLVHLQEAEGVHKCACVSLGRNALRQFATLQLFGQPLAKGTIQRFIPCHWKKLRQGLRDLGALVSTEPNLAI